MTWPRGNQVADGIKVARALTLRCRDYPGLVNGPNVITRIPKSVRWRHKGRGGDKRDDNMRRTWPDIAGCEMDHQALSVNINGFWVTQLSFFFFFLSCKTTALGPPGYSMRFIGLLRHDSGQGD